MTAKTKIELARQTLKTLEALVRRAWTDDFGNEDASSPGANLRAGGVAICEVDHDLIPWTKLEEFNEELQELVENDDLEVEIDLGEGNSEFPFQEALHDLTDKYRSNPEYGRLEDRFLELVEEDDIYDVGLDVFPSDDDGVGDDPTLRTLVTVEIGMQGDTPRLEDKEVTTCYLHFIPEHAWDDLPTGDQEWWVDSLVRHHACDVALAKMDEADKQSAELEIATSSPSDCELEGTLHVIERVLGLKQQGVNRE